VARMEEVLDLYSETLNPYKPVVSFDESPIQLIGETRVPIAPQPGKPARIDYEYKRNGTANLFVFVDAHAPFRQKESERCQRNARIEFQRTKNVTWVARTNDVTLTQRQHFDCF
jgi:hypothetical protein